MVMSAGQNVNDGDRIDGTHIAATLTAAPLTYADGATQVFTDDGHTIYTEHGRPTVGEWGVDSQGSFWSFWPPNYRASYVLRWIVENGHVTGVRFTDPANGSQFEGRYA
ncbi:MAG: hypothetical protein J2P23_14570 [Microlunatus sp.]|nr:hypothetical protein [Microlunatus sp.]